MHLQGESAEVEHSKGYDQGEGHDSGRHAAAWLCLLSGVAHPAEIKRTVKKNANKCTFYKYGLVHYQIPKNNYYKYHTLIRTFPDMKKRMFSV